MNAPFAYRVSVVVPVYNVQRYLKRCLDSLNNQTLSDIEIILVDDGSIDDSPLLCDEYAKRNANVTVIHKNNEGLGLARNSGLEICHGEYVAFVDSDDWVEPQMMELLYFECQKSGCDVIYSEFNVDEYPNYKITSHSEHVYEGEKEIEQLRLDIVGSEPTYPSGVKFQCSACKGLYRRSVIENNHLAFLSEREFISEDMLFNLEFLRHSSRVKTVPWQLYHYCLNEGSLTHSFRADRWEKHLKMIKILGDASCYSNPEELKLRLDRTLIFYTMTTNASEKRRSDIGFPLKLARIRELISTPEVVSALAGYPVMSLPIKWRIYTLALKYRLALAIYLIV